MRSAQVSVSPNVGYVGDVFTYKLVVHHDLNDSVALVPSEGVWVPFELHHLSKQTMKSSDGLITEISVGISVYETGMSVVPTQMVMIRSGVDVIQLQIPAVSIPIQSVLTSATPTPSALKDPMGVSISWGFYLGCLFVLILAVLSGFFGYRYFKKRFQDVVDLMPVQDSRSAYEIALETLQKLEDKNLAKEGQYKQHYLELSELLKALFSSEYKAAVLEMTTDETLSFLSRRLRMEQVRMVREILEVGDLVKFAKSVPDDAVHYDALVKAKLVIEWFKPVSGDTV